MQKNIFLYSFIGSFFLNDELFTAGTVFWNFSPAYNKMPGSYKTNSINVLPGKNYDSWSIFNRISLSSNWFHIRGSFTGKYNRK